MAKVRTSVGTPPLAASCVAGCRAGELSGILSALLSKNIPTLHVASFASPNALLAFLGASPRHHRVDPVPGGHVDAASDRNGARHQRGTNKTLQNVAVDSHSEPGFCNVALSSATTEIEIQDQSEYRETRPQAGNFRYFRM